MMRAALTGITLLLAGCGQADTRGQDGPSTAEEHSGPSIAIKPMAGVALAYAYAFRLPIQSIRTFRNGTLPGANS
jgi:hypothetical protein